MPTPIASAFAARVERDVRFAFRSLRRSPGFALGVIATIALALGLNATVFTIFNAYVLRPLAVRDPGKLYSVLVAGTLKEGDTWHETWVDWADYKEIAAMGGPVAEAASARNVFVRINEKPALGELVTGNYFRVLGVNTVLGRTIGPDDASAPNRGAVIVLGHAMWQTRYGGDPNIVGKSILVRGVPFTVIGVLGPSFTGLREIVEDFWAPITMVDVLEGNTGQARVADAPRSGALIRLADGYDANAAATMIGNRLATVTANRDWTDRIGSARLESRATSIPMDQEMVEIITPIAVAFFLILAIACANVANMMLARGLARQRELGIRMALGAGRRQVIAQLLTEALLLAVPAAVLGLAVSVVTLDGAVRLMFATFPPAFASYLRVVDLTPDLRVFGFMLLAATASAVLFGLAPALQVTRGNVVAATKGEFDSGHRQGRLRSTLVVIQMAACLLLLVSAGVLLRGAQAARKLDTGLRASGVVQLELNDAVRAQALAALRQQPGVRMLGAAQDPPASGMFNGLSLEVAGSNDRAAARLHYNQVSPEYFDMLGIRLLQGRLFTAKEAAARVPAVLVSETAARRLAPNGSAIGLEVSIPWKAEYMPGRLRPYRTARVVGVVGDAIAGMVFTGRRTPVAYYPAVIDESRNRVLFSVSGSVDKAMTDIERELERLVPGSVNEIYSVEQGLETQIYPVRAASMVAFMLGAVALILTLSGIYGVLSYLVTQRSAEMGIRVALGATARDVVGIVVGQSLRLAGIGAGIGLVLALGVSKLFATQIQEISTYDAVAYLGGLGVALVATLVAAWVPARRAASVDPMQVLRRV